MVNSLYLVPLIVEELARSCLIYSDPSNWLINGKRFAVRLAFLCTIDQP